MTSEFTVSLSQGNTEWVGLTKSQKLAASKIGYNFPEDWNGDEIRDVNLVIEPFVPPSLSIGELQGTSLL